MDFGSSRSRHPCTLSTFANSSPRIKLCIECSSPVEPVTEEKTSHNMSPIISSFFVQTKLRHHTNLMGKVIFMHQGKPTVPVKAKTVKIPNVPSSRSHQDSPEHHTSESGHELFQA